MRESKGFKLEIKEVTPEGIITGLASVYDNVDLQNDSVARGSFQKTLQDSGGSVPLLFSHDPSKPIGLATLTDVPEGLAMRAELVMETQAAQETFALVKRNVIRGLSIGYDVIRQEFRNGTRILKELKLFEVSVTAFPANPAAAISGIKSEDYCDLTPQIAWDAFDKALKQIRKR